MSTPSTSTSTPTPTPTTPASAISYTVIQQYSTSTRLKPQPLADIQTKITKPANKDAAWATHSWSYLMLDLHDVIRFGNITIRNAGTAFLRLLVGDTTQMQQLQRNPSQLSILDEMSILQPWTQMMSYSHRSDPSGRTRQKTFRSHSRFINGQGAHRCMIIQIRPFEDDPELTMGLAWIAIYGHKTPIASFTAPPPLSISTSQLTRSLATTTSTSTSTSSVLTSPPACPTHHQPCLLRKFRKPGPLHGHVYYVCAEKSGDRDCDYKQWADPADTKLESSLKTSSTSSSPDSTPDSTPVKRKAHVVEIDDEEEDGEKRMKTE